MGLGYPCFPPPYQEPSDQPLALLLHLNGFEEVLTLMTLPRPLVIYRAQHAPLRLTPPEDMTRPLEHRTFELTRLVSPDHKWWRVYNEGRSRTPEPAFVYMERRLQSR